MKKRDGLPSDGAISLCTGFSNELPSPLSCDLTMTSKTVCQEKNIKYTMYLNIENSACAAIVTNVL